MLFKWSLQTLQNSTNRKAPSKIWIDLRSLVANYDLQAIKMVWNKNSSYVFGRIFNSPTQKSHGHTQTRTLTSHNKVDGSSCRISDIVDSRTIVDTSISGSHGPKCEGSSSYHRPLGERPGVPRPAHRRCGEPCCYLTWQRDVLTRVHHVWLIHRQLQSRGCWQKSKKRDTYGLPTFCRFLCLDQWVLL